MPEAGATRPRIAAFPTLRFTLRQRPELARALLLAAVVGGISLTSGEIPGLSPAAFATTTTNEGGDAMLPMPFERPGDSFPGSAYYYLDASVERTPGGSLAPAARWDSDDPANPVMAGPGPSAQALRQAGSEIDRSRALSCLTAAVYYEAASEPDAGQRAVAQVVLNRVAHPAFPNTVCGVVYQGSERSTGCQFTFTCDGALARRPVRLFWERAEAVARAALAGYVYAPVGLATHYHTFAVHPYWADSLHFLGQIGAHRFYRMTGPAGAQAAFRFAYAGGEPLAAPHARSNAAVGDAPDPLAIERAYAVSLKAAHGDYEQAGLLAARSIAPPPVYAAEALQRGGDAAFRAQALPSGSTVRAEYQSSGRWIADPE